MQKWILLSLRLERVLKMAKFCGKCGTRLDEATGLCPNCDASALKEKQAAPAKAEKAAAPKMEKPEKKKKSGKWLVLLVAAAVVIAAVVFALAKFGVIGGDDYEVPRVDADDYFEDNATVQIESRHRHRKKS